MEMLNVNGKKLHRRITWYNYIKEMQILKICAIKFSYWVEIQVKKPKGYVLQK